jgi:hypothetical protein
MAIDQEIRQRAEELFIIDGLTLQEVASQQGISERTLANWSSEGEWVQRRREYQNAARDIKYYGKMTRLKLIKDAMTSLDPQKIYAFATLESTMHKMDADDQRPAAGGQRSEDIKIETQGDAVNALENAIKSKLMRMLENPENLNFKGVQDLQKAMSLVEDMKAKYLGKEDKSDRLLSLDEIRAIREQVL